MARSEQLRHTAAPLYKISGFYRAELSIMNAFTGALSGVNGVCAILQVSKVRTLRKHKISKKIIFLILFFYLCK